MEAVVLEEMRLLDGSNPFVADSLAEPPSNSIQLFTQDGSVTISSDDLAVYGNRIAYVNIPLQFFQDNGTTSPNGQIVSGYLINNNQVNSSILSRPLILTEDNLGYLEDNNAQESEQESEKIQYTHLLTTFDKGDVPGFIEEELHNIRIVDAVEEEEKEEDGLVEVPNVVEENTYIQEVDPPEKTGKMSCTRCALEFSSWKLYKKHKSKHLHDKPFQCDVCGESFIYETNLKLHRVFHEAKPVCPICQKHFSRMASLRSHIILHEREEIIFCNECGEEFGSPASLEEHMKQHGKYVRIIVNKVYKCNHCDHKFDSNLNLRNHLREFHKVNSSSLSRPLILTEDNLDLLEDNNAQESEQESEITEYTHFLTNFDKGTVHAFTEEELRTIREVNADKEDDEIQLVETSDFVQEVGYDQEVLPPDKTGKMSCHRCDLEFTSWKKYKKHKLKHIHDKPFQCDFCGESFIYETNLKLHRVFHEAKPVCPICQKHFSRMASLRSHIILHEREESLFCNECGEEFGSPASLEEHMKEHRKGYVKIIVNKVYKCAHCDNKFDSNLNLRNHLREFHKSLKYRKFRKHRRKRRDSHVCEYCNKSFDKPSQLLRHKRIHTGERPYKCDLCPRAFNQKGSLQIHMLKHTRERPYMCQYCRGTFSQKGNLQAHIMRLHMGSEGDGRSHKCPQCSCVFRKSQNLNAHITKLHGTVIDKLETLRRNKDDAILSKGDNASDSSNKENEDKEKKDKAGGSDVWTIIQWVLEDGSIAEQYVKGKSTLVNNRHKCACCPKDFKRASELVRHMRTHNREKPSKYKVLCYKNLPGIQNFGNSKTIFHCDLCDKSFSNLNTLRLHKRKHAGEKLLVAEEKEDEPVNGDGVSSGRDKADRRTDVSDGELVESKEGGSKATDETQPQHLINLDSIDVQPFSNNVIITEDGLLEVIDVPPEDRQPPPESQLTSDQAVADKPHTCVLCSSTFKTLTTLRAHLKVHLPERPFKCDVCPSDFRTKSALNSHKKRHYPKRRNVCAECSRTFSTVSALKRHAETHAPGFTWGCPVCGKKYKTHPTCMRHINTHNVDQQLALKLRPLPRSRENAETEAMPNETEERPPAAAPREEKGEDEPPPPEVMTNSQTEHRDPLDLTDLITSLHSVNEEGSILIRDLNDTNASVGPADQDEFISIDYPSELFAEATTPAQRQLFDSCVFLTPTLDVNGRMLNTNLPAPSQSHRCDVCQMAFSTLVDFTIHKASHMQENTCQTCHNNFATALEYEEHMRCHSKNMADSTEAEIQASNTISLMIPQPNLYRETNNVEDVEHVCEMCEKIFYAFADFENHIKTHHTPLDKAIKPTLCLECELEFGTTDELAKHNESFHPHLRPPEKKRRMGWRLPARRLTDEETIALSTIEPESASISEKVLLKSILEKQRYEQPTKKEEKPKKDMKQHPHKCKYCPKSFHKGSDLVRHLRTHTGERPFQCTCCNKSFSIKSTACSHMRTHLKERPYPCFVCGKLFSSTCSLKIHMRLHTGLKPYSCPLCDAKFRTTGHKTAHLQKHLRQEQEAPGKKGKKSSGKKKETVGGCSQKQRSRTKRSERRCRLEDEGSQYLVPIERTGRSKPDMRLPPITQIVCEGGEDEYVVNVEGDESGTKYVLAIKEGGEGLEDNFVVETLTDQQIILRLSKPSSNSQHHLSSMSIPVELVRDDDGHGEGEEELELQRLARELDSSCDQVLGGEGESPHHLAKSPPTLDLTSLDHEDLFLFSHVST